MASILICGNIQLFTQDALLHLAEEYQVVVAGETSLKIKNKNINIYHTTPQEEQFQQLFDVYSFQAAYFVSGYADGGNGLYGEVQQLEKVMIECNRSRVDKLIVLSTLEARTMWFSMENKGKF